MTRSKANFCASPFSNLHSSAVENVTYWTLSQTKKTFFLFYVSLSFSLYLSYLLSYLTRCQGAIPDIHTFIFLAVYFYASPYLRVARVRERDKYSFLTSFLVMPHVISNHANEIVRLRMPCGNYSFIIIFESILLLLRSLAASRA